MASESYKKKLRQQAEKRHDHPSGKLVHMSDKEVRNLAEELQIHQIELEIQNEELRHVQQSMEDTRNRYMSLFDNAPVGYVILDSAGIIKQVNSTFAHLLRNTDITKKGQAFADLLSQKDAAVFRARFTAFFKNPSGKQIEADIITGNGKICHVQMEAASHIEKQDNNGPDKAELLLMITDVTELKKTRQKLEKALANVKQLSGLLPICSHCKKIRDDQGYWNQIESYLDKHSDAKFSHGICQDCLKKYYSEFYNGDDEDKLTNNS
ncbi:MAG: PAS domain S-box protein [Desulfotignum sp.]|nr:PAS domain S-box protein [Desulfobacteraceae bacterium]